MKLLYRWRKPLRKTLAYVLLSIGAVVMLFPFIWMVSTSFKSTGEVFKLPPRLLPESIRWENYTDLWDPAGRNVNFVRLGWNTLKIATSIAVGQVITSSLAGYAYAKMKFPGRDKIFFIYFASIIVPGAVVIVPNFILMRYLGLVGKHAGIIIPAITSAYATFLMRQFFISFPKELEDAAKLDGCNPFQIYWHILIPNAKPILATQFLLTFQWAWNDFLWPLIMLRKEEVRTLQVGLSYLSQQYFTDWGPLMAASVITLIPIVVLFLFTQRFFIQSVKLTGIKG